MAAKKASKKTGRRAASPASRDATQARDVDPVTSDQLSADAPRVSELEGLKELRPLLLALRDELRSLGMGTEDGQASVYADLADSDPFYDQHPDVVESRTRRICDCRRLIREHVWDPQRTPANHTDDLRARLVLDLDWGDPRTITPVLRYIDERIVALRSSSSAAERDVLDDPLATALYDLLPTNSDGRRCRTSTDLQRSLPSEVRRSLQTVKRMLKTMRNQLDEVNSKRGQRGGYWKTHSRREHRTASD